MDKEALFTNRLEHVPYELPGGGQILIRGLSRAEALKVQACPDVAGKDALILEYGVAEPKLTAAEVRRWCAAWPSGDLEKITVVIGRLSGMLEESPRAAYKSVRDEPDE